MALAVGPQHPSRCWVFFSLREHCRGAHFVGPFNAIMPSVPPRPPPSRRWGWEVVVLRAYCGRERWDSWGELRCCLLSPSAAEPLRTMAGNVLRLRVAPASPPAGALSGWGRCFARAALFGADKLRKPGRRMEGSVKSLEPRTAGLRSGSHGMAVGRRSWKAPCSPRQRRAELGVGSSWMRGWLQASSSLIQ